eukprot:TRINITY_DN5993_c0_g2_i1.p1 TRINITY_DN5993_c0_g2~~TRINITY_DN5993_c0_g2_i1.p1  ORF type:complete len:603 (-),score=140.55 TRINITY_DN5993_c0_g2_i1:341-2104(-)
MGEKDWNSFFDVAWSTWFVLKCVGLNLYDRLYVLFSGKVDRVGGDYKDLQANITKSSQNPASKRFIESGERVHDIDVVIIGGGFGGICMGFFLNLFGISHVILEKSHRVGGVWNYNTYPGAACDVPSSLYAFSFCKLPPWGWKRYHACQKEILEYVYYVCDKFGISSNILYNTKVNDAVFADKGDFYGWVVHSSTKLPNDATADITFNAKFLVSAVGQLGVPKYTETPGLTKEDVKGNVFGSEDVKHSESPKTVLFHSAEWNHDFDMSGKTVAIIGNGPTGFQLTPAVVQQAKQVYVFMRSAPINLGKYDPPTNWFTRTRMFIEFHRIYTFFRADFLSFSYLPNPVSKWCNKLLMKLAVEDLEKTVKDEELRALLMPDPKIPVGCKRAVYDVGSYFHSLQKPNVKVIRSKISKFEASTSTIHCEDGNLLSGLDAVIIATGFESINFLSTFKIIGKKGEPIQKKWGNAPVAFLGITVPDFPNFFILYGPGTNTGGGSILFFLECQARYVIQAMKRAISLSHKRPVVEVKEEIYQNFVKEYRQRSAGTVFTANCASWYKTADGTVVNNWFGVCTEYWLRTHDFVPSHYQ